MKSDYAKLFKVARHARILEGISSHLGWDQETYMPPGSAPIRAEQFETMAGLIHRARTGKKFENALKKLIDLKTGALLSEQLSDPQKAALKEWRRDYLHQTALPVSFVEKFAKLTSQAQSVWRTAKEKSDFSAFLPYLKKIILLSQKKADLLGYQEHPYDALLDEYEPGMKASTVTHLFSQIATALRPLIIRASACKIKDDFLKGPWDKEKQIAFGKEILTAIGFDFNYGRLDFSSHPFSSASHPTDSRITTRMHTAHLMDPILVILHEGGHGLYEMGLPKEEYGTPLGEARSLGIHESQSRWWETRIGLSLPFWTYFFPKLKELFKQELKDIELHDFYLAIHKVSPSFIRVEADELTYPMHVVLRFELEKQLIEGTLKPKDIPEAWNAKMQEYLGITPPTDREGCLQDIHWSMGGFGYFPTYTLGNIYAAHLFTSFSSTFPDWTAKVAKGDLGFIRNWLHENIYRHGKRYSIDELLKQATCGRELAVQPYIDYLSQKYDCTLPNAS